jgi:hypothetical protein
MIRTTKGVVARLVEVYSGMHVGILFKVFIVKLVLVTFNMLRCEVWSMQWVWPVTFKYTMSFLNRFLLSATSVITRTTSIFYLKPLLEEVINLLNLRDWSISIHHCFRKANLCANMLVKQVHNASFHLVWL